MNPNILIELARIRRQALDEEHKKICFYLSSQAHRSEKTNRVRGGYKEVSKDDLKEEKWKRDD